MTEEKNKGGRPPFEITDKVLKKAEELASKGLTQEQIAGVLGMGLSTLMDKKTKFPEFADAIKRGQSKGISEIANALFTKAKGGDVTSMIFYLKCRAGWRELEQETKELPPINITLNKD